MPRLFRFFLINFKASSIDKVVNILEILSKSLKSTFLFEFVIFLAKSIR